MTQSVPQRIVTISIIGTSEQADVYYSFLSPVTGLYYTQSPLCDLKADEATNILFILDYQSSKHGWIITETSPRKGSPTLESVPGALQLSILVMNPYTSMDIYNFYIHYQNANGTEMERDPQIGNVRPPN